MGSTESRPAAQNTSIAEFLTNLNRHYILTQIIVRPQCFQSDSGSPCRHSQHTAELQPPLSFFPQILSFFFTGRERLLALKVLFAFQNWMAKSCRSLEYFQTAKTNYDSNKRHHLLTNIFQIYFRFFLKSFLSLTHIIKGTLRIQSWNSTQIQTVKATYSSSSYSKRNKTTTNQWPEPAHNNLGWKKLIKSCSFLWSPTSYSGIFWITLKTSRNLYFPRITKANCIYKAYTLQWQFWPTTTNATRKRYGLPHLKGTSLHRELAPHQGESHPSACRVLVNTCKIQLRSSACGRGSHFTAWIATLLHEMQGTAATVLRDQGGLLAQRFPISLMKLVRVN